MVLARNNGGLNLPVDDFETRGAASDHGDLRLWLRMMAVHKLVTNEARRRLRASFNMSLSRFDLMAQLDANSTGLRMGEISNRLMVTTGNITGLTDELEAEGLVERSADPRSRRALRVRLTPKGRRAFRAAAKANENWITEFFSVLSAKDKKAIFEILGAQKAFLQTRVQQTAAPKSRSFPRFA
ncbi:MAG: MarR family winged helix-turn-helix transcriptional regulator [Xanthobacteraceae bacterium]